MSIDSKRAIARALTLAGAKVWYVPAAGLDMPDLLARNSHGTLFGLIVETAQTPAKAGTSWTVVRSELEAVRAIGAYPGSDL